MKQIHGKTLIEQLRGLRELYKVVKGRVDGIPLNKLVDPSRISSDQSRKETSQEQKDDSFYASLVGYEER